MLGLKRVALLIVALLLVCGIGGLPLMAQGTVEVAVDATSPTAGLSDADVRMVIVSLVFAVVMLGALIAFTLILRPMILQLGSSAPEWTVRASFDMANTMLVSVERYAKSTPTLEDDMAVKAWIDTIKRLENEIAVLRKQPENNSVHPDFG
jgi:hypothetical protein